MVADGDDDRLTRLEMLASALAGRALAVSPQSEGEPPWTDGQSIYVDATAAPRDVLEAVAVQAALIAAGSLRPDVMRALARRPRTAERFMAVEGHRALHAIADLLPGPVASLADVATASRVGSVEESLSLAAGKGELAAAPTPFGVIRAKRVLATAERATRLDGDGTAGHVPRREGRKDLEELDDGEVADPDSGPDPFTSPVGGGGFIGKWLKKMLSSARSDGSGGGPPGADSPTHRTNSAKRGAGAVSSTASLGGEDAGDVASGGYVYPEWDANRKRYHLNWCTVREVAPRDEPSASQRIDDAVGLRRPLARLGMGLHRRHRQSQGDDIDLDAAVEARVEMRAGAVPDEAVYLDSLRRRRDLSVLVLLDVSGSAAEAGTMGKTIHQQQLVAAANLVVALHDLGDRVAMYAYNSQGRSAVNLLPVKRFDDHVDSRTLRRLNGLEPAAYSRLGAAIRHGASVVETHGGTSRRLLVVLSDGLAYDHGYERAYGAADARRALTEARRRGTGCVCLTIGASVDAPMLRNVFGSAAHASVGRPEQLVGVIGPLFRSAVRAAEVRRRVS